VKTFRSMNLRRVSSIPFFSCIAYSFVLFGTSGCLTSQREEQLQSNIRVLENRIVEMEKGAVQRDKSFDSVKTNAEDVRRNNQAAKVENEDLRRQLALTQGAVDELRIKVSRLQEVSGQNDASSENLKLNDLAEQTATIDRRLAKIELEMQNKDSKEKEGSPAKGTVGKFKNPAELSKVLAASFTKKDYKKVIQVASSVLDSNSNSNLQEVALEYRAESQFHSKNYEQSAIDFSEFLTKFPKSDRRARALLLGGDSYVYLSQIPTAKGMYEECFKKFPSKEECKAAKERFNNL
jgi:TolA-binding protein